jgi:soluble lytic murein transglycosylase-like protein
MIGRRYWLAVVVFMGVALPAAHAEELLYYENADGRVVITNVPSHPDARPVPGFEERVAAALRGDLPATPWDRTIGVLAGRYGISPDLVKAVALVESNLQPDAVSPKGAMGLMQLMPATAERYGVEDPFDPEQSLNAGARHLRDLLDEFGGDVTLALAAYNAGSGAVRRYRGVPSYPETQAYVRKVRSRLAVGRRARDDAGERREAGPGIEGRRLEDGTVLYSN